MMYHIRLTFLSSFILMNLSCSSILDPILQTDSDKFYKNNQNLIVNYNRLVDIGNSTQYPCDLVLKNAAWTTYSFRLRRRTSQDTIQVITSSGFTNHIINWTDSISFRNINQLFYRNGQVYLLDFYPFEKGHLFAYSLNLETFVASPIFIDTLTHDQALIGSDSAYIYFKNSNGSVDCFSFDSAHFVAQVVDTFKFSLHAIHVGGFLFKLDSCRLKKTDSTGFLVWKTDSLFIMNNLIYLNNFIYVCGFEGYSGYNANDNWRNYNAVVAKIDLNGNLQWKKTYKHGNESNFDILQRVIIDSGGNIICLGSTGPWGSSAYGLAIKIDQNGNLLSEHIYSNHSGSTADLPDIAIFKIQRLDNALVDAIFLCGGGRFFYAQMQL